MEISARSPIYDDSTLVSTQLIYSVNITSHHAKTQTNIMETMNIAYIGAKNRHSHVSAEEVARKLRCRLLETAKQTLKTTTQYGVRHALHPLHQRYHVHRQELNAKWLMDTFYTCRYIIFESEIVEWKCVCSSLYKWLIYLSLPNAIKGK
jgi:hypothetical protein